MDAEIDDNREPTIIAVSKIDLETPSPIAVVTATGALVVEVG